jgi:hypothetical protein
MSMRRSTRIATLAVMATVLLIGTSGVATADHRH